MEKREPGVEVADDMIVQQYPSPTADGQDVGQYYTNNQHEHQVDPQMEQKVEGQQDDASLQNGRRPSVSVEELQLAAQLSQGLAPMMEANHEEHNVQNHDPGLQSQDQHLQAQELAPNSQDHTLQVQDPNLDAQDPNLQHHQPHLHGQDLNLHQDPHLQQEQTMNQIPNVQEEPNMHQHSNLQPDSNVHQGPAVHQDPNMHQNPSMHEHSDMHQDSGLHQDPNMQAQDPNFNHQDTEMQNQEHVLHAQDPGYHGQDPNLHGEDPALHHGLPLTDQPQHDYAEGPQPPQHLPPHIQMAQMAQQAYAGVDTTPPRKRSKVSRACDECRRKKVKCDAISETGEDSCSNCRRSQIQCLFSRVPQKRGPSKGYIKELADRINSIEGKLGSQVLEGLDLSGSRRESAGAYSPASTPLNENAKRPFSSISGDGFQTPAPNRPTGWASEPRNAQSYQTAEGRSEPQTPSIRPPRPLIGKPDGSVPSRPANEGAPVESLSADAREIDDAVFHSFVSIIYPSLPFLASSKARVQETAAECPATLQAAFVEALYATMESFQAIAPQSGDSRMACRLLTDWELEGGKRSCSANLVHLQTLMLLAIEADNHGPLAVKGYHGGISKSSLLARAVVVAYAMGLREMQVDATFDFEADPDSQDKVSMRAWWALVALDRFNAIGTGQPLCIPEKSVVLPSSSVLRPLVGEALNQFAKLVYVLGPSVTAFLAPAQRQRRVLDGDNALSNRISIALELWRHDLPADITPITNPVVHLAFWHCRLLEYLLAPTAFPSEVLWAAQETLQILSSSTQLVSPFNHYFTCLATLILSKLTRVDKTREKASQLLVNSFLDGHIAPSTWDNAIRDRIAEMIRPSTGAGADAAISQSLQHLADLATATTELGDTNGTAENADADHIANADAEPAAAIENGTTEKAQELSPVWPAGPDDYEDLGFDPLPILRAGYLTTMIPA